MTAVKGKSSCISGKQLHMWGTCHDRHCRKYPRKGDLCLSDLAEAAQPN